MISILAAACAGAAAGAGAMWSAHLRWAEAHHYRRVRLEATRVRELHATADHERRLRQRVERRLDRAHEGMLDLLTRLGETRARGQRQRQPRPQPARRNAVPDYGPHAR